MYGLPDQPSRDERRDQFERELYDSVRLLRASGPPVLMMGVAWWITSVLAGWVIVGAAAGVVTGLGLILMAVGSRWLARKHADSVYGKR